MFINLLARGYRFARRYNIFGSAHRPLKKAAQFWRIAMHEICPKMIADRYIGVPFANDGAMEC